MCAKRENKLVTNGTYFVANGNFLKKSLLKQIKRHIGRFPADFMFQLTKEELGIVKSQIVTSSVSNFYSGQEGGRRKPPYPNTQGLFAKLNGLRKKMIGATGAD